MPTSANFYVSPLSASNINNFGVDVGIIAAQQGGGTGLIFVAVSDNLEGAGIVGNPLKTKDNIQVVSLTTTNNATITNNLSASTATIGEITANSVSSTTVSATTVSATSVTSSLKGDGSQVTNITASNIPNFTNDVRAQFTAGQNINITNGLVAVSGVLPVVNGGTGLSSSGVSGNILISNGTGLISQTVTQDLTITSGGVATVRGLQTNPLRSPSVTPPSPGDFLKWGGTDWFPAPVSATVLVGSLQLTADPPQTITANGQTILPTSAYWRLLAAGNFNAGPINYAGAGLGQILFIQVPIGQAGSVTFNKSATLALGSNTRKVNAGGSLQLIYDGTRWIEMFFNTSTSI